MSQILGEQDFKYIMSLIGILLLILVGYVVIFSPYFKISPTKILIEPLSEGIDVSIVQRSSEKAYGKSIFTLDESKIASTIKKDLPNTEYVRIDRLLPNGIKILVRSLPIQFDATIFGVDNKRFGVSSNGVLVPIADLTNANFKRHLYLVGSDLQSELFLGYKKIISDRSMFIIAKIFDLFEKEWQNLTIVSAKYFLEENELHIILESNTKVIFALQNEKSSSPETLSDNLLKQLVTLQTYINKNNNALIDGSTTYIDARVPGKIFACSNQNICKQNLISIYGKSYE